MDNKFVKIAIALLIGLVVVVVVKFLWKAFTWLIWVAIFLFGAYVAYAMLSDDKSKK
ncbi:hypothetical protein [Raineya orbicola]|jgi:uncharacterized membrane protein|uniref:Uncharacterized protein n=1 Tax=Raineya orbicola TaxID=2016530 RepID=A0A2N3IHB7_9BACT|nr:hypothetical protein [Raineya orbicola]PKQ69715.1 hypothetical protein Rain11_1278 [Raineya orbicola]